MTIVVIIVLFLLSSVHLNHVLTKIMSAISTFAAAVQANQDKIDSAVAGLTADVANLNEQIEKLQNTPGEITPEDQLLLDSIQEKTQAVADKLDALDQLTPPKAPQG